MTCTNKVTIDKANLTEEECKQLDALTTKSERPLPAFKRADIGCRYWALSVNFTLGWTRESLDYSNKLFFRDYNYFLTEEHATNVAAHLKNGMWFLNKATKFAGDYKFKVMSRNYYMTFDSIASVWSLQYNHKFATPGVVYMSEANGGLFLDWLKLHATDGELQK